MGTLWGSETAIDKLLIEGSIEPQPHLTNGIGINMGATVADADVPEGAAIIYFDGGDIVAKRKLSGVVTSTTLSGVWA